MTRIDGEGGGAGSGRHRPSLRELMRSLDKRLSKLEAQIPPLPTTTTTTTTTNTTTNTMKTTTKMRGRCRRTRVFSCFSMVFKGFLAFGGVKKSLVFWVVFLGFYLNTKEKKIREWGFCSWPFGSVGSSCFRSGRKRKPMQATRPRYTLRCSCAASVTEVQNLSVSGLHPLKTQQGKEAHGPTSLGNISR